MLCDIAPGFAGRDQRAQHCAGLKGLPWVKQKQIQKGTETSPLQPQLFRNGELSSPRATHGEGVWEGEPRGGAAPH